VRKEREVEDNRNPPGGTGDLGEKPPLGTYTPTKKAVLRGKKKSNKKRRREKGR